VNNIKFLALIGFLILCANAFGQSDPLLTILNDEINREKEYLFKSDQFAAYYMDYRINETHLLKIEASFGSITESNLDENRILTTNVRVGNYKLDNTHDDGKKGENPRNMMFGYSLPLPLENSPEAIKQTLWYVTDKVYKQATDNFKNSQSEEKEDDEPDDFSREPSSKYYEEPIDTSGILRKVDWEKKLREFTRPFLNHPKMVSGNATIQINIERKYFVSSEGTTIVENMVYSNLWITGSILTDDGDVVPLYKSYFAFKPDDLPSSDVILQDVDHLIQKLDELRSAPLAEPYTGPAILSKRSAGVFFHEIFGHRVEGHRLRNQSDGQTFLQKVGKQVLPVSMSITFDPTMKNLDGQDLVGHYLYDDEGTKGQKVEIVRNGILKTFLMSRTPLKEFPHSNGHGRASAGLHAVSRQSNLIVDDKKPVDEKELRKLLIAECKKQGKTYGYLFEDVTGGYTITDVNSPNVFNITPTEVYRIYVDGRPDELVRGVNLIGTPLAMFAEIQASGKDKGIFTGICGAESGGVPVSAISPALFVRRIETQKNITSNIEAPALSKPSSNK